jgi:hypothetical protein
VQDSESRVTVHRLFTAAGRRFLLSASSDDRTLNAETLEPVVKRLQRTLGGER